MIFNLLAKNICAIGNCFRNMLSLKKFTKPLYISVISFSNIMFAEPVVNSAPNTIDAKIVDKVENNISSKEDATASNSSEIDKKVTPTEAGTPSATIGTNKEKPTNEENQNDTKKQLKKFDLPGSKLKDTVGKRSSLKTYSPVIKTIQKKNFIKAGRFELTPALGYDMADAYVRNATISLNATYHLTEVFAFEGLFGYSPSFHNIVASVFGDSAFARYLDLQDITLQLEKGSALQPQTSKLNMYGHAGFVFSPIYGKYASLSKKIMYFDVYFMAGAGFIKTMDRDYEPTGKDVYYETTDEIHVSTHAGAGIRITLKPWMALRFEGREYVYIESVSLNSADGIKQSYSAHFYFIPQVGLSFFLPTKWK